MPTATYAIVAHSQHDWRYEEVHVRDPKDDELLVEMIASGICHTDIAGLGDAYPRVLGHEGKLSHRSALSGLVEDCPERQGRKTVFVSCTSFRDAVNL